MTSQLFQNVFNSKMIPAAAITRFTSLIVVCGAAVIAPAIAEEESDPHAVRFNVVVDVDPSRVEEFEAAWMIIRDRLEEDGYRYYSVVSENGAQRMLVSVIDDYANLSAVHEYAARYSTSDAPEVSKAVETLTASTVSFSSFTTNYDGALSYAPPGSYAGPFHQIRTLHFDIADRDRVALLLEKRRALWEAAGVEHAFHVLWGGIGAGASSVAVMTSASDRAAHQATFQAVNASLEAETLTALENDFAALIKREAVVNWNGRIDLRIFPTHMRKD